jgi:hypothetical protein
MPNKKKRRNATISNRTIDLTALEKNIFPKPTTKERFVRMKYDNITTARGLTVVYNSISEALVIMEIRTKRL